MANGGAVPLQVNEVVPPLQVAIDPIKYLSNLPVYNGNKNDLYKFIELVDRVFPLLSRYDQISQEIFMDILKSRLTSKAREAVEIENCNSWGNLKTLLLNNFGDRLNIEQLYDELRALTFKTNCFNFYKDIKSMLCRLNNKTKLEADSARMVIQNSKTALRVFINKVPEPMRGILCCRNPNDLESAMQILHETGYAFTKEPSKNNKNYKQTNNNNSQNQNYINYNDRNYNYRNRNPHRGNTNNNYPNNYNNNNNNSNNDNNNINTEPMDVEYRTTISRRSNLNNNNKNFTHNNNNNQNYNNSNRINSNSSYNRNNNSVEHMDIAQSTSTRRAYNVHKRLGNVTNFQTQASENYPI